MRLIDADAFKKVIRDKLPLGLFMKRTIPSAIKTMGELVEEVDQAPTVDQWHYPSKGEYPPKEQEYFVAFKTDKEIYYDVRVLNPDLNNLLLGIGEQIYAWQYIIPPKEEV